MASIAFLDDSFPFTGATLREKPLGGVQSATVLLAEALAARSHQVTIRGMVTGNEKHFDVAYRPLMREPSGDYDIVIANRAPKLLRRAQGKRRFLWLHNPANYLRKPRHVWPYLKYHPSVVFIGSYHHKTWLPWLPLFQPTVIPYGVGPPFTTAEPASLPPPPRAIFTSNPRRSLDWLLEIWIGHIRPRVPEAELHVFAGRGTYGSARDDALDKAVDLAANAAAHGVVLHDPCAKDALANELRQSRVMLYRGDSGETFCGAAAEAQTMGVPLVTAGVGSLGERVTDGITGFVRDTQENFAEAAIALLTDDGLWRAQHEAALASRQANTWDHCARHWEWYFTH
jgi:glycosyltransferase involved in cell wall biosynthesis